jgi:UDP-glucose 4-epimerase
VDEFLAIAYWREKRLPTVIARLFNTVGPRQTGQYGMVVPRFVRQALMGRPITVYGDGRQSRCFTHVQDSVRALVSLMDATDTVGEVYNVGGSEEVSMLELAHRVKGRSGSTSEITFVPYAVAYEENFEDMPRRVPDTAKIRRAVGWQESHTLDAILDSVITHHRESLPDVRASRPEVARSA